MIENLKSAVLSVCMISICVAVCTLICPDTVLTKQVRFLISLLFIISLAVPLTDIEFPESLVQIQEQKAQESAVSVTKECAERALLLLLSQADISCTELHVTVHIDEHQRISITEVSAVCDDYQNTCRILHEAVGEGAELHVTQILE